MPLVNQSIHQQLPLVVLFASWFCCRLFFSFGEEGRILLEQQLSVVSPLPNEECCEVLGSFVSLPPPRFSFSLLIEIPFTVNDF